jgi:L-lactate utilization protein LutB
VCVCASCVLHGGAARASYARAPGRVGSSRTEHFNSSVGRHVSPCTFCIHCSYTVGTAHPAGRNSTRVRRRPEQQQQQQHTHTHIQQHTHIYSSDSNSLSAAAMAAADAAIAAVLAETPLAAACGEPPPCALSPALAPCPLAGAGDAPAQMTSRRRPVMCHDL